MKAILTLVAFLLFSFFITIPIVHASDIVLNEFIANPQSGESEWVEFYNTTNSTIDLSDYYFDDDTDFNSDSGSSAKIALAGLLPSFQTCFLELSSYLNNNGDSPSIFKSGNILVDSYSYSSSSAGLSYSRIPDGGSWLSSQTPTKASNKCIDLAPTATPTSQPTATSTNTPTPTVTVKLTPTPTITKAVSRTPSPTKEVQPTGETEVLGQTTESIKSSGNEDTKDSKAGSINIIPLIFISIGLVFLLLCVIVVCYPYIKSYVNKKNE